VTTAPDAADAAGRPVALVTGAGRRVGQALAVGLAGHGYDVAVHHHASAGDAATTADMVRRAGGEARLFAADLTSADAPAALVREAAREMGRLDVVVNSAAVMLRTPIGEVTTAVWDLVLDLNLRAPFFIAQEAARHLPDGGSIVNIADLAAFETWPGYVPHGVSKSGIVYLTRALARVLAPRVRVNAVAPGTVLLPEGWDADAAERLLETTPLRRWGSPADVVQAVLYLVDATYVTGETIIVDGGRLARH
jgi:pteridine reductase